MIKLFFVSWIRFMSEEIKRTKGLKEVIHQDSVVLILGTLPGQESIDRGEYYSDPTNKFWDILFQACGEPVDKSSEAKNTLLQIYKIALWDILESAVRVKTSDKNPKKVSATSDDKSLKDEKPNNLPRLLAEYPNIKLLLFHSNNAYKYFRRFFTASTIPYICVSSPSGQNRKNINEKTLEWRAALSSVIPQLRMGHRLEQKS